MPERKDHDTDRTIEEFVALSTQEVNRVKGWVGSSRALRELRQRRPKGSRDSARLVIQSLNGNSGQATLLPPHHRYASLMFSQPKKNGCQVEFLLPLGSEPHPEKTKTRAINCPNTTPLAALKITTTAWADLQRLLSEPITGQIEVCQDHHWQTCGQAFSLPSLTQTVNLTH